MPINIFNYKFYLNLKKSKILIGSFFVTVIIIRNIIL